MSDPIWYYARGDSEQGPISTAQIKALAAAGALRREDLVWKEGMENWLPARDVDELFPTKKKEPSSGKKEPTFRTEDGDNSTSPQPARPSSPRPHAAVELDVPQMTRWVGRALVILGMLIVLMSRGCDSLGLRRVARLQAIADSSEAEFQRQWQREKAKLEDEQLALNTKSSRSQADRQRLQKLSEEITDLDNSKRDEQLRLQRGTWQSQKDRATTADAENRMWSYWRRTGFLFGTMALALGLLAVTSTSEGPERWISLVMLAVLLYSVYSSNSVWDGKL